MVIYWTLLPFVVGGIGLLIEGEVLARRRRRRGGSLVPILIPTGGAAGLLLVALGLAMTGGVGSAT